MVAAYSAHFGIGSNPIAIVFFLALPLSLSRYQKIGLPGGREWSSAFEKPSPREFKAFGEDAVALGKSWFSRVVKVRVLFAWSIAALVRNPLRSFFFSGAAFCGGRQPPFQPRFSKSKRLTTNFPPHPLHPPLQNPKNQMRELSLRTLPLGF